MPDCRLPRGRGLSVAPLSSDSLSDDDNFIKCLSPLDRHLRGICPPFCLGSFRGEGSCPLIGGDWAWLASRLSPLLSILLGLGCFRRISHWRSFVVFAVFGSPR
jgi:hypothetical protein